MEPDRPSPPHAHTDRGLPADHVGLCVYMCVCVWGGVWLDKVSGECKVGLL